MQQANLASISNLERGELRVNAIDFGAALAQNGFELLDARPQSVDIVLARPAGSDKTGHT